MLKTLGAGLLSLVLFFPSPPATAETDPGTAETLMRESGLWQQLNGVAPQVRAGLANALAQQGRGAAADEVEQLSNAAEAAYAPERLRTIALAVIAKGTNPKHVPTLRTWYRSPTGIAITKQEEAASNDPRDPSTIFQEGEALLAKLPESRRALLKKIVKITRSAEATTNVTINTAIAVQMGLASATPGALLPSPQDLRSVLEAQRPQMQEAFATMSLAVFAAMYAPLPDRALAKYVTFLSSAAGTHFTELGLRALDTALIDAAGELGRGIPAARAKVST